MVICATSALGVQPIAQDHRQNSTSHQGCNGTQDLKWTFSTSCDFCDPNPFAIQTMQITVLIFGQNLRMAKGFEAARELRFLRQLDRLWHPRSVRLSSLQCHGKHLENLPSLSQSRSACHFQKSSEPLLHETTKLKKQQNVSVVVSCCFSLMWAS